MERVNPAESTGTLQFRPGFVGQIPIRNIWLLMLYASEYFRQAEYSNIQVEENPEDIPDLVAEILAAAIEKRLKRNLSYGFIAKDDVLNRVRGKIDIFSTERNQLLARGKVACHFTELTVDTTRNRYVRSALDAISNIVTKPDLRRRCRALVVSMRRIGVTGVKPTRSELSVNRLGRHDFADIHMFTVARLAFDLALPSELVGSQYLTSPERGEKWMRTLYEKAVAGFYSVILDKSDWRVRASRSIQWDILDKTSEIDRILPKMRTDIELENVIQGFRLVIDTKFTSILKKGWYRDQTLSSQYIYQIYSYLRSQEDRDDLFAENATGLLLHPSIGEMVDESVKIQGHVIRFVTVDLAGESKDIRKRLLDIVLDNHNPNEIVKKNSIT